MVTRSSFFSTYASMIAKREGALNDLFELTENVMGEMGTENLVVEGDSDRDIWMHNARIILSTLVAETIRGVTRMER